MDYRPEIQPRHEFVDNQVWASLGFVGRCCGRCVVWPPPAILPWPSLYETGFVGSGFAGNRTEAGELGTGELGTGELGTQQPPAEKGALQANCAP
jgi:hypothetical protein